MGEAAKHPMGIFAKFTLEDLAKETVMQALAHRTAFCYICYEINFIQMTALTGDRYGTQAEKPYQ